MSQVPVIEIHAGEDLIRDIVVYADAAQTIPLDLTGSTLTHKIYTAPGRDEVYEGVATVTDGPEGEAASVLPPGATDTWDKKVLYGETVLHHPEHTRVVDSFKLKIA